MTDQRLKIDVLLADVDAGGEVLTDFVTQTDLQIDLANKADLVGGKVKPEQLPTFSELNGVSTEFSGLETKLRGETDLALNEAKEYADGIVQGVMNVKADLVGGRVPTSQAPLFKDIQGAVSAINGLKESFQTALESVQSNMSGYAKLEGGKVSKTALPTDVVFTNALTVFQSGIQNSFDAFQSEVESDFDLFVLNSSNRYASKNVETSKADKTYVDNILGGLRTKSDSYSALEVDSKLGAKPNKTDVYSKTDTYNKTEVNTTFSAYVGGRKGYTTLALAQAAQSTLPANTVVDVTNDTTATNNGTYQWNGSTLTKSAYDPLTQAKAYADSNALFNPVIVLSGMFTNVDDIKTKGRYICDNNTIASGISGLPTSGRGFILDVTNKGNLTRQDISHIGENFSYTRTSLITGVFPAFGRLALKTDTDALVASSVAVLKDSLINEYSLNLFNPANAVTGSRVSGIGVISPVAGAKHTGMIPVIEGEKYIFSWSNSVSDNPYYSFFANKTDTVPIEYSTTGAATSPRTFTVPKGANFVVINLKHIEASTERVNFQVELGTSVTSYKPWVSLGFKIRDSLIPSNIVKVRDFPTLQSANPKSYEKVTQSVNLFDESQTIENYYLLSSTGNVTSSSGWKISGFIPVVAGQTYTLSGTRARQGISFFTTNTIVNEAALLYDNNSTLPLTVTAPVGANYAVIALETSSAKGYSNIQFEAGTAATPYIPYDQASTKVLASHIEGIADLIPKSSAKASYKLTSGTGTIKCGLLELGIKVFNPVTYLGNPVFNFNNDKYNGATIRLNGDDVAPVRMMGATIGANHGYSRSNLTLAAHGKTVADVGSVWTDGTNQWVIVQINSVNAIGITCRNANIGYSSLLPQLTHVSGAINTASFTPTAVSLVQWYPMLKNHSVKLYADGNQITDTTIDSGYNKSLKVVESYDLMEKSDIVEWLILNGGKEVTSYSAASALNVNQVHSFTTDGSDVISSNFFTYKALSAATDLMFTQSARLTPAVDGSIKYYVPRSISFVHESQNFDFSKLTVVDSLSIVARIDFTAARTETGKAVPDRLIMFNNTIGYAVGYLPILDAAPEVRNGLTSKGIQISQSAAKVYPYLVDGLTTLSAGSNYSCVAYRKYFKRPIDPRRTVEYDIPSSHGDFLFLDWHTGDFKDTIILPEYMQSRVFEVVEKTDNVELLTKIATGQIAVNIGTVTSNARLIIKFN